MEEKFAARTFYFNQQENAILENHIESKFNSLKNKLNSKKSEINKIFKQNHENSWRDHTKRMHPLRQVAKKFNNRQFQSSQAFSKFFEILCRFQHVLPSTSKALRSFHLCEGPGHFIAALDLYLKSFQPNLKWEWNANTLDPYFENTKSSEKLLDDTFIFNHYNQWIRGEDGDGDIFKLSSDHLHNLNLNHQFNLVTADGSFYVQNNPGDQEMLVFELIEKEINVARILLKPGGTLVVKIFTIFETETQTLIKQVSQFFDECVFYKPMCSKPGNSEKYAIFLNYNPSSSNYLCDDQQLLNAEEFFTNLQISAISRNLETFGTDKTDKEEIENQEIVNEFLDEIDFFSLKISKRSKNLEPHSSSPWKAMFGNNLVDRISKIQNFDETILNYLQSNNVISSESDVFFEFGNFETSPRNIENRHSLFIDPTILHCLENSQKFNYLDIFQNCSTFSKKSENFWNFDTDSEITVALDKLRSMQDILTLIDIIREKNINIIHFTWIESRTINLILSRFSASIFGLFKHFFKDFEFFDNQFIFNGYNGNCVPQQLDDFIKNKTGLVFRNFLTLKSLASLHSTIFNFNLAQLEKIKR